MPKNDVHARSSYRSIAIIREYGHVCAETICVVPLNQKKSYSVMSVLRLPVFHPSDIYP